METNSQIITWALGATMRQNHATVGMKWQSKKKIEKCGLHDLIKNKQVMQLDTVICILILKELTFAAEE